MKVFKAISPIIAIFRNRKSFARIDLFRHYSSNLINNSTVIEYLKVIEFDKKLNHSVVSQLIAERQSIEKQVNDLSDLKENDKEMLRLINDEMDQLKSSIVLLNSKIVSELCYHTEEERDVIIEVSAGVGGKEAMHFANELFEMYQGYSNFKRWGWEEQERDMPESGRIRHASAFVSGRGVSSSLLQETGVHRVQRVPATEKSGRIHTSTVTVAVLPQPTDVEVVIKDKDIKMETKTSSGAGGQHVNKTETCVRITHLPTGIVIENQTDRSQIRNKKIALQRLRSKLYQMELDGFLNQTKSSRKEQVGSSLRSEKIRTYNFNQDRVTDHRLGLTIHNLPIFLSGGEDLDQMIHLLLQHNMEQKFIQFASERLNELSRLRTKG